MKKLILLAVVFSQFYLLTAGQGNNDNEKNPQSILFSFDGESVTKDEFLNVYQKNNSGNINKESLNEYLQLYINFRLKVKEAEELGLDTLPSIQEELAMYRSQLAESYMNDKEITEKLLKEAYERMGKEINTKHMLVKLSPNAPEEKEEEAINLLTQARKRIAKGESFEKVAKELSQNQSLKIINEDIGYLTAFQTVYPFESMAYNTKTGEVSQPFRTRFGYHILKVEDVRSARGQVKVAHIFKRASTKTPAEKQGLAKKAIEDVYQKLQNDEIKWAEAVQKISEDKTTKGKNGELPWFGAGKMVPSFEDAAFNLEEPGDISKPVQTEYGWHIIRLIDKQGVPSFEEVKGDLKKRVERDTRSNIAQEAYIKKLKTSYDYKEYPKAKAELKQKMDQSLLSGKWKASNAEGMNKIIFEINDTKFTQADFAKYIERDRVRRVQQSIDDYYGKLYDEFVNNTVLAYERDRLEEKYPEFKALMQEYRDGILLFELTDKKVWSKAVEDTAGLKEFFKRNKENYMWDERLRGIVFHTKDAETAEKAKKLLNKKRMTPEKVLEEINQDNKEALTFEEETLYERGQNLMVDQIIWKMGLSKNIETTDGDIAFVKVTGLFEPEPKTLDEARGYAIADYQEYLEKSWIESLRKKYPVKVNEDVLNTLAE